MKASIDRAQLETALARAASFAAKGARALPVLQNVLIRADGNAIQIIGTDIDNWCRTRLDAFVEQPGETCAAAVRALELVKRLEGEDVAIELSRGSLAVKCGRAISRLPTIDAAEFPLHTVPAHESFSVDRDLLRTIAETVAPFASDEISRPTLSAVCWRQHTVASASNHSVVRCALDSPVAGEVLVPSDIFARAVAWLGEKVSVRMDDRSIHFDDGTTVVSTRLIEGAYPNYDRFFSLPKTGTLTVGVEQLLAVLGRADLFTVQPLRAIALACLSDGAHQVSVRTNVGIHEEFFDAEYDGGDFWLMFNPSFIVERLQALSKRGAKTVRVTFGDSSVRPVIIESPEVAGVGMVLMPVNAMEGDEPSAITERAKATAA